VEYVVILALVSLVVILTGSLLGPAINRIFGIATGAMGTHYNTVGSGHTIEIVTAECIAIQSQNLTGLWVTGNTDEPLEKLVGSTNLAVGTGMNGDSSPVESNGPGSFKFHPLLSQTADLSVCPTSVVIQANDGAIALSPITEVQN
jgi:Flp pilus assembly pilin Flp